MLWMIVKRLLWSIPLLIVVTAFSFILISFVPGDAALSILGETASADQVEALREELGLNQPLPVQYAAWLASAVRGDLGTALFSGAQVTDILFSRLAPTLALVLGATLLAAVLGIVLGTVAAVRGGWVGRVVEVFSLAGHAIPQFWLGLVFIAAFAVQVRWFPPSGYVAFEESPGEWLRSLVLPVVTLGIGGMTLIAGQARDSMLDVLDRDFVRVLRANGFSGRSVLLRHALRNAAIPVLTAMGIVFVSLLSGSVLIESVFSLPGLGGAAVNGARQHDLVVIQGAVVFFTVIVIVVNLLVDIAYRLIDPRVRIS